MSITKRIIGDDRTRLLSKIRVPSQPNDCWIFTGARSACGYGNFYLSGKYINAHRASYLLLVGPIEDGLEVDHLCHSVPECAGGRSCVHRLCVKPSHLATVTHRENDLRGAGVSASNAAMTHCKAGHLYTAENTYRPPRTKPGNVKRECRICHRDRERIYRRRHRGNTSGIPGKGDAQ